MLKLEQQVCSLELAKKLKELGVKQESLFYWRLAYSTSEKFNKGVSLGKTGEFGDYEIQYYPKPRYTTADIKWNERDLAYLHDTELSAFTVAELGSLLPKNENLVLMLFENGHCQMCIQNSDDFRTSLGSKGMVEADTEADARAKMLIYLLENKLL